MDYSNARKLAEIIIKVRLNKATDQEREFLLCWLDESEANRQTYRNIISGKVMLQHLKCEEDIVNSVDMDAICKVIIRKLMKREIVNKVAMPVASAAGFIAIILGIWLSFFQPKAENSLSSLGVDSVASKVKLVMDNGEVIGLDKKFKDSINLSSAVIVNKGGELVYKAKDNNISQQQKVIKNKIITEVGGECSFVLSDGTKVWLNALSEIEFPVNFESDKRVVSLKGEAYFEVAKDSKKPFIVHSLNQTIQVLGTSFNIKAYEDEDNIYTTLIEGKLSVGSGGKSLLLTPGMESVCKRETNEITLHEANTEVAVAWRLGYFMFNEQPLDDILKVLNRWYGVSFEYDNPPRGTNTFSGRFSKYGDINTTLKSITLAGGPRFIIEENTVHIIP